MKCLNKQLAETTYTLELSQIELDTIICAYGAAIYSDCKKVAKTYYNITTLNANRHQELFGELCDVAEIDLKVDR